MGTLSRIMLVHSISNHIVGHDGKEHSRDIAGLYKKMLISSDSSSKNLEVFMRCLSIQSVFSMSNAPLCHPRAHLDYCLEQCMQDCPPDKNPFWDCLFRDAIGLYQALYGMKLLQLFPFTIRERLSVESFTDEARAHLEYRIEIGIRGIVIFLVSGYVDAARKAASIKHQEFLAWIFSQSRSWCQRI